MPSNHLILCRHLLLLPSIFSNIRVFSSESVLHIRWPNYWSFSFSISPSNEYSGLISFRIGQGTLKSLLQHHNLKASILWHSAFFMVQLSYPYKPLEKLNRVEESETPYSSRHSPLSAQIFLVMGKSLPLKAVSSTRQLPFSQEAKISLLCPLPWGPRHDPLK